MQLLFVCRLKNAVVADNEAVAGVVEQPVEEEAPVDVAGVNGEVDGVNGDADVDAGEEEGEGVHADEDNGNAGNNGGLCGCCLEAVVLL